MSTTLIERRLSWRYSLALALLGVGSFHLAYQIPQLGGLILLFALVLIQLTRLETPRLAFYWGLSIGLVKGVGLALG